MKTCLVNSMGFPAEKVTTDHWCDLKNPSFWMFVLLRYELAVKGAHPRNAGSTISAVVPWHTHPVFTPGITTRLLSGRAFLIHSVIFPPNHAESVPTGSLVRDVSVKCKGFGVGWLCIDFYGFCQITLRKIRVSGSDFLWEARRRFFASYLCSPSKYHQMPPAQCCL